MSQALYTMAQAVKASGVSEASIRNYTSGRFAEYYVDFLSPGARPGTGQARLLTDGDIILLRYIHMRTGQGATHETIKGEIEAGALADFEPPEVSARQAQESRQATRAEILPAEQSAALVSVEAISRELTRVMSILLERLEVDNATLQNQLRAVTARVAASQQEAAGARGELATAQQEVRDLRVELAALRDQRRAAEARAVAAETERDFLRGQIAELRGELAAARRGIVARLFNRG